MQKIPIFLRANYPTGVIVDSFNTVSNALPTLLRGTDAQLEIVLFGSTDSTAMTQDDLAEFTSWSLYADIDYSDATTVKLSVAADKIAVDADGKITVQLVETNTEQLATAISTSESISLIAELLGYKDGESKPSFAVHFPLRILNRVWMDGAPTPSELPTFGEAVSAALASMFSTLQTPSTVDDLFSVVSEIVTKLKGGE